MRRKKALRWTVVSLTALLVAALAGSIAIEDASAMWCAPEYRSCASDGDGGGGSYEGSEPRPQYEQGREYGVLPGAPGWNCNHPATCRKCDDWFKYVAEPTGRNAEGKIVVLRMMLVAKRDYWDWFCS